MRRYCPARAITTLLVLATTLAIPDAQAARRSTRIDFGTEWGSAVACDPRQTRDNALRLHGWHFRGYLPLAVQTVYCQQATALRAEHLYSPQDADLKNVFRPGETISAARYTFMNDDQPFSSAPGHEVYQWAFYYFPDALVIGLYGPSGYDANGNEIPLAIDNDTTHFLFNDYPGGPSPDAWRNPVGDVEYLCFKKIGMRYIHWFSGYGYHLQQCRDDTPVVVPALLAALPDVNGNGSADIAVVRDDANLYQVERGPLIVEIRDGADGASIRTLTFPGTGHTAVDVAFLPDSDGDGSGEIALLSRRPVNGAGLLRMRNISGPQLQRSISYSSGLVPLGLAVPGDLDDDLVPEISLLAIRSTDGRGLVDTRNASGDANRRVKAMRSGITPQQIAVIDDADGNGVAEFAVLGTRDTDGLGVVEIANAAGAGASLLRWQRAGRVPVDMAVLADSDGDTVPEVAVLSAANSSQRTQVDIMNAAGTAARRIVKFTPGSDPLALETLPDADGNGIPELVVLGLRDTDFHTVLETRNAAGVPNTHSAVLRVDFWPRRPRALAVLPDTNADGMPEIAVLTEDGNTADLRMQLLVENLDAYEDAEAWNAWRYIWLPALAVP